MSSPNAESGTAPAPAGLPPGGWATPGVPAGNGPQLAVQVVLPPGVVEALTLGPGDVLVVRVPSHASSELFDQVGAQIAAGPLKGRVLLVAAEQIAAVRA